MLLGRSSPREHCTAGLDPGSRFADRIEWCYSLLKYIEGPNGPTPIKYKYGSCGPEEQFEFEKRFNLPVDR